MAEVLLESRYLTLHKVFDSAGNFPLEGQMCECVSHSWQFVTQYRRFAGDLKFSCVETLVGWVVVGRQKVSVK